ncbi:MAG: hypothetical protein IAE77_11265 [Prosthecobacter sp.]|jgi:hypothetical protein|uniref:hypothetical protein n=1 Tax=Prosthecobacter sp. TaxID=1965333 RepID=UPI0019E5AA66|nr:hypothetical protein [Prosthecobacter sp.]MBE2284026.1 hypothetical protein [Prosthecobacter sp.]
MKTLVSILAVIITLTSAVRAEEGKLEVAGLSFKFDSPWAAVESSGMFRAGTLQAKVEGVDKPLEAVFYHFPGPGGGGGVEANVQRWLGQFQGTPESKREELDAGGKKITLVTASGTYNDGPPMGAKTPRENYTLLAAIVPTEDSNVFVKLAGPKDVIAKIMDGFKKMVTSPFAK